MPADRGQSPDRDAGMPSETVRTVITLALGFHFFLAILAIVAAMPVVPRSTMVDRLDANILDPLAYPDVLLMQSFAFPLTQSLESDYDLQAEVILDWENGDERRPERVAGLTRQTLFSPDDVKWSERRARYLALMRTTANLVGQESAESVLTKSIADVLLADAGLPDGTHRFRLRRVPTPNPAFYEAAPLPAQSMAFEADLVVKEGKLVSFTKAEQQNLSSPVDRRRPAARNRPPARQATPNGAPADKNPLPELPFPAPLIPGGNDGNP